MSTANNPTTSIGQAHLRKLAHFFLVIFQVITCLLACGCSSDVSEQGITLNGWERIEIPGVGSIEIPDSMEVQDDEYQDAKEAVTGTDSDTFIIQQAGLNEGSDEAMNTYARIMISCDQGSSDDYPPPTSSLRGALMTRRSQRSIRLSKKPCVCGPQRQAFRFSTGTLLTSWKSTDAPACTLTTHVSAMREKPLRWTCMLFLVTTAL